ncbi:hypothetical protein [Quatrionicoccus australiensis]|uniref:hypothetical protein n=1 Tax=Quatrionicoccus australiensis TaxID=138118 RepID=UPI001CF9E69E|nr:hypothetical protein [Quatrionicoccus australiensis]MCB4361151.1 hypothetical protein [Quatrionicoccus australiensis]
MKRWLRWLRLSLSLLFTATLLALIVAKLRIYAIQAMSDGGVLRITVEDWDEADAGRHPA